MPKPAGTTSVDYTVVHGKGNHRDNSQQEKIRNFCAVEKLNTDAPRWDTPLRDDPLEHRKCPTMFQNVPFFGTGTFGTHSWRLESRVPLAYPASDASPLPKARQALAPPPLIPFLDSRFKSEI